MLGTLSDGYVMLGQGVVQLSSIKCFHPSVYSYPSTRQRPSVDASGMPLAVGKKRRMPFKLSSVTHLLSPPSDAEEVDGTETMHEWT